MVLSAGKVSPVPVASTAAPATSSAVCGNQFTSASSANPGTLAARPTTANGFCPMRGARRRKKNPWMNAETTPIITNSRPLSLGVKPQACAARKTRVASMPENSRV